MHIKIIKMLLRFVVFFILLCGFSYEEGTVCGDSIRSRRGVINTPNFPKPYPIPISCRWTIEAPRDHVIALYFTQFYMRTGVSASEYVHYFRNAGIGVGKTDFGKISSDREPTYLITDKPVLVLEMTVRERSNVHMRVRESLLDVFGFNITYEIVPKNSSVRRDACLYHHCSFNGNCFASANSAVYYCQCFSKYFGDECQYDTNCGPSSVKKMCLNGGTCRYYIGSTVRTCECPDGFSGARCEIRKTAAGDVATAAKINVKCESWYVIALPKPDPFSMTNSCEAEESRKMYVEVKVQIAKRETSENSTVTALVEKFAKILMKKLPLIFNMTVDLSSDSVLMLTFNGVNIEEGDVILYMKELSPTITPFQFLKDTLTVRITEVMSIQRIESSDKIPVMSGEPLVLACIIRGSGPIVVSWLKDGEPLLFDTSHQRIWVHTIPRNSEGQINSLLGFDRAHVTDSGEFSCRAQDGISEESLMARVTVRSPPQTLLSPLTVTVSRGENLFITCLSEEDIHSKFRYKWTKDGKSLKHGRDRELVEDLFPAGSRLIIDHAESSATYKCTIASVFGSSSNECEVTVLNRTDENTVCPEELDWEVHWSMTAVGSFDTKLCPTGFTGFASRECSFGSNGKPSWIDPDFSGCVTVAMASIQKQLTSLKMGYRIIKVNNLLHDLHHYVLERSSKMHPTEGEPVIDILSDVISIGLREEDPMMSWKLYMDIATLIFQMKLLQKETKLIKLQEVVVDAALSYAAMMNDNSSIQWSYYANVFGVEVCRTDGINGSLMKLPRKLSEEKDLMSTVRSLEARLSASKENQRTRKGDENIVIAVVFFYNDFGYITSSDRTDIFSKYGKKFLSHLLKVKLKTPADVSPDDVEVEAKFQLNKKAANVRQMDLGHGKNISCVALEFGNRRLNYNSCITVDISYNSTLCRCSGPGTYAVIISAPDEVEISSHSSHLKVYALVSSFQCLLTILMTLMGLIISSRTFLLTSSCANIQLCLSVLLIYFQITIALSITNFKDHFPMNSDFLQFLYLFGIVLQPSLVLVVYMECKNVWIGLKANFMVTVLAWGFPTLITGCTCFTKAIFSVQSKSTFWLQVGSLNFHIFTISVFFFCVVHIILVILFRAHLMECVKNCLDKKPNFKSKFRLLWQSSCVLFSLLLSAVTSILLVNVDSLSTEYAFSLSSVILSFAIPACSAL